MMCVNTLETQFPTTYLHVLIHMYVLHVQTAIPVNNAYYERRYYCTIFRDTSEWRPRIVDGPVVIGVIIDPAEYRPSLSRNSAAGGPHT
jgi:hypothetical protein